MKMKVIIVALVAAMFGSGCATQRAQNPVATERALIYGAAGAGMTAILLNNIEGGKKARSWAIPVVGLLSAGGGWLSGANEDSQNEAIRQAEVSARTEYVTISTKGGGSRVVEVYRGADGFYYCRGIRYPSMPTAEQLEADGV